MESRKAMGLALGVTLLLASATAVFLLEPQEDVPPLSSAYAHIAGPNRLEAIYSTWASEHEANGGDRNVVIPLAWSKAYSRKLTRAKAMATLDLIGGSVTVEASGLEYPDMEVWLVANRPGPGRSAMPEPGDELLRIGVLGPHDGKARLRADLSGVLQDFQVDHVVICRSGENPGRSGVIFGSPDLFQRRYTRIREQRAGEYRGGGRPEIPPFETLVARGADLFFNETFQGNGRTCGTCHPAENNLTLDPRFIAGLPPDDPLFVAEFVPELARNFENPKLMRKLALILENVDGFDDLETRFVMRAIPHTLAQGTSITPAASGADGTTIPPAQRTGWAGDGAPGTGSLREFANGAVRQHFTRTLARQPGRDFRFATDEELDAIEAFLLSLGRDEDPPNIAEIGFRNEVVSRGRDIFLTGDSGQGAAGKCNRCHANAGASVSFAPGGLNFNFDTGVEELPDQPADLVDGSANPPDGGFGSEPMAGGGLGSGSFNTPPLIEAADTGPFFHNNAVETIEEAVGFYNSRAFNESPAGRLLAGTDPNQVGIRLEATQVVAVAAFLRVMNALENIRAATEAAEGAKESTTFSKANPLLRLAAEEAADARDVLDCGGLHPAAASELGNAVAFLQRAASKKAAGGRASLIARALEAMRAAAEDMVEGSSDRPRGSGSGPGDRIE